MPDPNQIPLDKLADPKFLAEEPINAAGMTPVQDAEYDRTDSHGFRSAIEIRAQNAGTYAGAKEVLGSAAVAKITEFTDEEQARLNRQARMTGEKPPFSSPFDRSKRFSSRSGNQTKQGNPDHRLGKGAPKVQVQSDIAPASQRQHLRR